MMFLEVFGVALLSFGVIAAFEDCAKHCVCTRFSFSGSVARCTSLDARLQTFPLDIVHLVVEGYQEERLPPKIFADVGLEGLLSISLTNSSLRYVDKDTFHGLIYLEDLDLSYNKIERLDPHTFEKIRLKRFIMNGNTMSDTRAFHLPHSYSITELTLANCNLTKLENIDNLERLEFLDLSGNKLTELEYGVFSKLIYLEEINLSDNLIKQIDRDTFADLDMLTDLNIRGNPLRTLQGIKSPYLKSFDASDCEIDRLQDWALYGLKTLNFLNLSKNSIESISAIAFRSVQDLRDLDLSYNKLRGPLSSLMFEFNKRLETLSFQGNSEIKFMPGFKGDFPYLYRYDISKCGLKGISNDTFKGMEYLVSLNVSGNALVHIDPKTFSNLPNLIELDISNNLLHGLSSKLFQHNKELSKLYISGNNFLHLSAALFQPIPKLRTLDVSNCGLTTLWNTRYWKTRNVLRKLTTLNLSGNNVTRIYLFNFNGLENLHKLDISNNPFECTLHIKIVMEWLTMKRVVPDKDSRGHLVSTNYYNNRGQWYEIFRTFCPKDFLDYKSDRFPIYEHLNNSYGRLRTSVPDTEDRSDSSDATQTWNFVFNTRIICFVLIKIVPLVVIVIYFLRRYRRSLLSVDRPAKAGDGSPAYLKLDEEHQEPVKSILTTTPTT